MSEQYYDGQVVNGHRYDAASNSWIPLEPAQSAGSGKKTKKWPIVVGIVVGIWVLGTVGAALSGGDSPSASNQDPVPGANEPSSQASEDITVPEEEPAPEQDQGNSETLSQSNAREKAQSYLDYSSFSRQGLIEQLEYEGFSKQDATYGVDALDVDWNEQAALKAQSYLDYSSFSRQGLIEQLEYEGFTSEQAAYGADAVGF